MVDRKWAGDGAKTRSGFEVCSVRVGPELAARRSCRRLGPPGQGRWINAGLYQYALIRRPCQPGKTGSGVRRPGEAPAEPDAADRRDGEPEEEPREDDARRIDRQRARGARARALVPAEARLERIELAGERPQVGGDSGAVGDVGLERGARGG